VNDAPPKGLTKHSAERRGARLRFERQRLTCIRSLYFKLRSLANASTRARQSRAQVSLAAAQCATRLRHRYQAPHLCVPVRLGSRSNATVERRHYTRESEVHGSRRAHKAALIHKLRQREAARRQATESHLTYYLSGEPKASPLEGWVRERVGNARPEGLNEHTAERRSARLRLDWQRPTCILPSYSKLGPWTRRWRLERQRSFSVFAFKVGRWSQRGLPDGDLCS